MMKREYVKPVFCAEEYVFNSSIATCDIDIDTTEPLTIIRGKTKLCPVQDNGHTFGGSNGNKGSITTILDDHSNSVTLFNDGDNLACKYDWDGRVNIVAQTGTSFADSFFGNEASQGNHAPAYNGKTFMS